MRFVFVLIKKYFTFKIFLKLIKVASFILAVGILAMSFSLATKNTDDKDDKLLLKPMQIPAIIDQPTILDTQKDINQTESEIKDKHETHNHKEKISQRDKIFKNGLKDLDLERTLLLRQIEDLEYSIKHNIQKESF